MRKFHKLFVIGPAMLGLASCAFFGNDGDSAPILPPLSEGGESRVFETPDLGNDEIYPAMDEGRSTDVALADEIEDLVQSLDAASDALPKENVQKPYGADGNIVTATPADQSLDVAAKETDKKGADTVLADANIAASDEVNGQLPTEQSDATLNASLASVHHGVGSKPINDRVPAPIKTASLDQYAANEAGNSANQQYTYSKTEIETSPGIGENAAHLTDRQEKHFPTPRWRREYNDRVPQHPSIDRLPRGI